MPREPAEHPHPYAQYGDFAETIRAADAYLDLLRKMENRCNRLVASTERFAKKYGLDSP